MVDVATLEGSEPRRIEEELGQTHAALFLRKDACADIRRLLFCSLCQLGLNLPHLGEREREREREREAEEEELTKAAGVEGGHLT